MTERLYLSLPGDPGPGPETGTPAASLIRLGVPSDLHGIVGRAIGYSESLFPDAPVSERVLPDGLLRLAFDLSGGSAAPVVIGPRLSFETVLLQGRMQGVSVEIRPAAAQALLGIPVAETVGQTIPLAELWGATALDLGDRLVETTTAEAQADSLFTVLRRRMEGRPPDRQAGVLERLIATGARPAFVAGRLQVGQRRLQQLCQAHLGLDARSLRRLARWHRLLRSLRCDRRPDWAGLAAAHGWSDQAHMVRDFRAFSGLSPTQYLAAVSLSFKTAGGPDG